MNLQSRQWNGQYELERDRLIQTLGNVVEGGIIEAIQHVGATSVPDLYGSPCVDIGLAVWPFPLEAGPKSQLEKFGYQIISGYEEAPEQRFLHESKSFQLIFVEHGSERWSDLILTRDYLRYDRAAREELSRQKKNAMPEKKQL